MPHTQNILLAIKLAAIQAPLLDGSTVKHLMHHGLHHAGGLCCASMDFIGKN